MRYLVLFSILCLAGCSQQESSEADKKNETVTGFATQEITGTSYQFHIPSEWKPFDLTGEQFENSIKSADVGENPEKTRETLRKARESGFIHFMALAKTDSKIFTPTMTVTVVPSKTADLNVHLEANRKRLAAIGKVTVGRIDKDLNAIYLEAQVMAGNPKRPVKTASIIRANDRTAVTLNYSYLPEQANIAHPAVDLAWKTFKLK